MVMMPKSGAESQHKLHQPYAFNSANADEYLRKTSMPHAKHNLRYSQNQISIRNMIEPDSRDSDGLIAVHFSNMVVLGFLPVALGVGDEVFYN